MPSRHPVSRIRTRVGGRTRQRIAAVGALVADALEPAAPRRAGHQPARVRARDARRRRHLRGLLPVRARTASGFARTVLTAVAGTLALAELGLVVAWGPSRGLGAWVGPAAVGLLVAGFALGRYAIVIPPPEPAETPARRGPGRARRSAVLFVNPRSGGGKAETFDLVGRARRAGDRHRRAAARATTSPPSPATPPAGDAEVIGVAGGDGSQACVLAAAAEHDIPSCASRRDPQPPRPRSGARPARPGPGPERVRRRRPAPHRPRHGQRPGVRQQRRPRPVRRDRRSATATGTPRSRPPSRCSPSWPRPRGRGSTCTTRSPARASGRRPRCCWSRTTPTTSLAARSGGVASTAACWASSRSRPRASARSSVSPSSSPPAGPRPARALSAVGDHRAGGPLPPREVVAGIDGETVPLGPAAAVHHRGRRHPGAGAPGHPHRSRRAAGRGRAEPGRPARGRPRAGRADGRRSAELAAD